MSQNEFEVTEAGEPHALRRRALLARTPEIRALFGYDPRTAWVTVALVLAQLACAAVAGRTHGWPVWIAAYLLGAPLTHWLAMAIHETSHRLALRTARGNTALALLANLPLVLPFAITLNRYHLEHHRSLNVLGLNTDLPLPLEVRLIGRSAWRKLLWVLLHPLVYLLRGATFAKSPTRGEVFNGLLLVAVDAAIYPLLGPWALGYLGLSFFFALGLHPVAAHFIHEHYAFAKRQETFSYYGPLNAITFNVGYHNEHHDFMNVPGSRLPALRCIAPEYDALVSHRSWTGILWRFITDPSMSYGSRIVRTRAAFERGRVALAQLKASPQPQPYNERMVLS